MSRVKSAPAWRSKHPVNQTVLCLRDLHRRRAVFCQLRARYGSGNTAYRMFARVLINNSVQKIKVSTGDAQGNTWCLVHAIHCVCNYHQTQTALVEPTWLLRNLPMHTIMVSVHPVISYYFADSRTQCRKKVGRPSPEPISSVVGPKNYGSCSHTLRNSHCLSLARSYWICLSTPRPDICRGKMSPSTSTQRDCDGHR